jgi:hypothetical protein
MPSQLSRYPAYTGHGTVYNEGIQGGTSVDMVSNYNTMVHPYTTAVTGAPSYVFILPDTVDEWQLLNCQTAPAVEARYQSIMASAHTDGAKVIGITGIQVSPAFGCPARTTDIPLLFQWMCEQVGATSDTAAPTCSTHCGMYFDEIVDVDQTIYNPTLQPNYYLTGGPHLSDAGNALWADDMNGAATLIKGGVKAVPNIPPRKGSCSEVWVGSGTASALTAGDDAGSDNTCYNDSGATRTITAVKCRSDVSSNTTTVSPTFGSNGSGTTILSGALTCGSSLVYSASGTVSNAAWVTGTGINPVMGGTLTGTSIALIVEYTF